MNYAMMTLSPAPPWWGRVWVLHQIELSATIRTMLAESPTSLCRADFSPSCRHYDPREVDAALSQLVADGAIGQVGDRYLCRDERRTAL